MNHHLKSFFEQQRNGWQLAKKHYDDLSAVRTRDVDLDCGATVTVQCNPARIVSTAAKIDKEALAKRPCFLCGKNRPAEQKAYNCIEGFDVLINPFPILPVHFTMPSREHEPQTLRKYFPQMLDAVATALAPEGTAAEAVQESDICLFYNGPRSGASAPDHFHFQIGLTEHIPYYNKEEDTPWPAQTVTICHEDRETVIAEFRKIYDALPVPVGEDEPMFNVFVRRTRGCYEVTLFLRSQHRPANYGTGEGQRLISPGALDLAGLLITPREEDFMSLTDKEIEAVYREVSAPELCDYIDYCRRHEGRKISVGLMETDGEIRYRLNGRFTTLRLLNETIFIPRDDKATFTIENMVIGVNFHWQQTRSLTFSGILKLAATPEGKRLAINILTIEDYLKSVISSEMSAMSDFELLKAHAILSRSWLIANIDGVQSAECRVQSLEEVQSAECRVQSNSAQPNSALCTLHSALNLRWYDRTAHTYYDVCADDHCQRYQGVTMQTSTLVSKAVDVTRSQVLMYEGEVCDARFSKCCGGRTEEYQYCWDDTPHPYLESVECPFCNTGEQLYKAEEKRVLSQVLNDYDLATHNFYRWTALYDNPDIKDIFPLERGKSGRLWKVKLIYNDGTEEIVGKELEIRRRLSDSHLYSSWFNVHKTDTGFRLEGQGWGHGVGLCQIGAAVMAHKGFTYKEILKHYFPKAEIKKVES